MSITLSCNVFPDNQQSRPTTEEVAEHDAYLATLPPPPHPTPGSIGELLARLDPSPPAPEDGVDPITAWLCELVTRPVDAVTRVAVAALDPATLTGKAARDYLVLTSARKASQLVHLLESTTPEVAAQIDTELAEHLHAARPSSLRRRIARRLLALDSDYADRQDREVVRGRTVRTWSNPDGSATLSLTGPPEAIQHAWHATTGTALAQLREASDTGVRPAADTTVPSLVEPVETTSRPGDFDELNHRGANNAPLSERDGSGQMDRARFDAAIDLLCSAYDAPWFPASQGKRRTLVQLVTTVATLTGIDDNICELVGHGAVTAQTAPLGPRWRASASQ